MKGYYSSKKPAEQSNYLRAADEYAFLLSEIAVTTNDSRLNEAAMWLPGTKFEQAKGTPYKAPATGAMNSKNKGLFQAWINQHVKPGYRGEVEELLTDPAKFAKKHPNHKGLSEMLND